MAVAAIALGLCAPARGQAEDVTLLLKQSPVRGGEISPVPGIYHFEPDSQVALTAVPKPGYRFLHWLGDVSDPTSTKTVVRLDRPKVIIAVFEQSDDHLDRGGGLVDGGGGGSLFPAPLDLSWPGGLSATGGGARPQVPVYSYPVGGNQPVPEPATGLLLLAGGLLAFRRRGARKS
ncbi:MAG: PEP-CTERM sorting domain-containing protein [Sedimentisphaerales bacterium]